MAQHSRNGHHNEDNGADTTSYIFNPMSYNYHPQNQVFTAPTVLSQQDATVMADFFNNNPNSNHATNTYPGFGVAGKGDFTAGSMSHPHSLSESSMANSLGDHSHVNYAGNLPQQSTNNQMFAFDFGHIYPQGQHQQSNNHTARDAVAGASALLGLSTSQEQANLLNANNYMTWQTIVGAQLQTPSNNNNNNTSTNTPGLHKGSNSQIHSQTQSPQLQHPITSWAEVSAQAMQQRTRHPSLQLDTTSTMPSHTHQHAWQNAPHSALPQTGSRRPAVMARFGSDNAFSPHGFGSASAPPIEDKRGLVPDPAVDQSTTPVQRGQVPVALMRHNSMSASVPVQRGGQSSPVMGMHHNQMAQSVYGHNTHGSLGQTPGSARKRTFSNLDDNNMMQNTAGHAQMAPNMKQAKHGTEQAPLINGAANAKSTSSDDTMPAAPASGSRRRAQREPKPPRQNLTDAQKRQNHIASEQKRRDTMKVNFDLLSKRVPVIRDSGAMSRSEILYHVANHIESAKTGNAVMCRVANITMEQLDAMSDSEDDDDEDADGEDQD